MLATKALIIIGCVYVCAAHCTWNKRTLGFILLLWILSAHRIANKHHSRVQGWRGLVCERKKKTENKYNQMKQQTVTKSEFRRKRSVHPFLCWNIIAFTQPSVVVSVANTKQTEASTKWLSAATINNILCTMDTCYFLYGFRFHNFFEHLFHMRICIMMRRDHTNTHIWRHPCHILYHI